MHLVNFGHFPFSTEFEICFSLAISQACIICFLWLFENNVTFRGTIKSRTVVVSVYLDTHTHKQCMGNKCDWNHTHTPKHIHMTKTITQRTKILHIIHACVSVYVCLLVCVDVFMVKCVFVS